MKKTINANIGNTPFTLDEDAFVMLESYFESLREVLRYQKCDPEEVIADIEMRSAEILSTQYGNKVIITRPMIEALIEQMGDAEDIIEIESTPASESIRMEHIDEPTPPPFNDAQIRRRLYRSVDEKMIGGVCGGLAEYFNIDVTWVRLGVVLLAILTGSTIAWAYLILWIILPAARSPYQKMQLKGTLPTLNNIGRTVAENFRQFRDDIAGFNSKSSENRGEESFGHKVAQVIVNIVSILAKAVLIIITLIAIPVLVAAVCGAVGVLTVLCCIPFKVPAVMAGQIAQMPMPGLIGTIAFFALIVIAIPLFMLVVTMVESFTSRAITTPRTNRTIWTAWGVALGVGMILSIVAAIIL